MFLFRFEDLKLFLKRLILFELIFYNATYMNLFIRKTNFICTNIL